MITAGWLGATIPCCQHAVETHMPEKPAKNSCQSVVGHKYHYNVPISFFWMKGCVWGVARGGIYTWNLIGHPNKQRCFWIQYFFQEICLCSREKQRPTQNSKMPFYYCASCLDLSGHNTARSVASVYTSARTHMHPTLNKQQQSQSARLYAVIY